MVFEKEKYNLQRNEVKNKLFCLYLRGKTQQIQSKVLLALNENITFGCLQTGLIEDLAGE